MFLESKDLTTPELYKLLVGSILPRPIAWVSSKDENGVTNLAPYSCFTIASCNPPVLSISHMNPNDRMPKDTFLNLQITGECVVNIVSTDQAEQMNQSCANYPASVSEFDAVGIETTPSQKVSVVGVKASKVRYECALREIVSISDQPMGGALILLDIRAIYIDDTIYIDNEINSKLLDAIGKLGGNYYVGTQDTFTIERPKL
ncbi:MAG: hypothetical protein ISEC1_P0395 [Thiomicrorhabdus sp.]|nr:MAG: hypothetical protein ISEC1_P0395 [Thiomicrorhabdus sp.]